MRKLLSVVAALAILGAALTACEQPAEEGATEGEEPAADTAAMGTADDAEAGIESLRSAYVDAYNARDWNALLVLHTEDYEEVTPEGETMTYSDVEAAMQDTAQAPPEGATLTIETETLEIADSGDLAYGTGTSTVAFTGPEGEETTQTARWMAGFEKDDGEWKIDRLVTVPTGGEDPAMGGGTEAPAGEGEGTAM